MAGEALSVGGDRIETWAGRLQWPRVVRGDRVRRRARRRSRQAVLVWRRACGRPRRPRARPSPVVLAWIRLAGHAPSFASAGSGCRRGGGSAGCPDRARPPPRQRLGNGRRDGEHPLHQALRDQGTGTAVVAGAGCRVPARAPVVGRVGRHVAACARSRTGSSVWSGRGPRRTDGRCPAPAARPYAVPPRSQASAIATAYDPAAGGGSVPCQRFVVPSSLRPQALRS